MEQVQENIQELIETAEALADEAESYIQRASEINDQYCAMDARNPVPLDEQPYGEELALLGPAPQVLRELVVELERASVADVTFAGLDNLIDAATKQIESVQSTLWGLTELPSDEDEFDDDGFVLGLGYTVADTVVDVVADSVTGADPDQDQDQDQDQDEDEDEDEDDD
ncbi:hypothetical protein KDX38_28485 [Pseudomonas sp. CDFA 602]|uniref:hypothetical protein n=1 Tax=Pseudomonas californiensis TaxID=2829823 RepID=UPI001E44E93F|nr:hypothetical protein [Pseudomonas californiensis]MCD5997481.1 hypothetical protein [Pseudomonas californiensis]MCD6003091.1 hypothetical protein [Pseudomonas californiensis]